MDVLIKWYLFAIFIFGVFASEKKNKTNENKFTALQIALQKKDEKTVNSMLNNFDEKEKQQLISYLMKKNEYTKKNTTLHFASANGHEGIAKLFLNEFSEEKNNEKMIEYVIKEDELKRTALHLASVNGHEEIVKLLLKTFREEDKEKLIEYVMKENKFKATSLHLASLFGHEKIVSSLLNVFGKDKNDKLIEYLMKENKSRYTALRLASQAEHENIVNLLSQKFNNANNENILCDLKQTQLFKKQNTNTNNRQVITNAMNKNILRDLQQLTKMFNIQNTTQQNESILWSIFVFRAGRKHLKEIILSFLFIDYDSRIHIIEDDPNFKKRKRKTTDIAKSDELHYLQNEASVSFLIFYANFV